MVTIKRIGVASAFKVGALVTTILWAIVGLIVLGFQALFLSAFGAVLESGARSEGVGVFLGLSVASLCGIYFVGLVINAVLGGISGALYALIYNVVAGWVGGVEVELERTGASAPARPNPQQ